MTLSYSVGDFHEKVDESEIWKLEPVQLVQLEDLKRKAPEPVSHTTMNFC